MNVSLCIWFLLTLSLSCHARGYSQPFDSIDGFIPITQTGQFRRSFQNRNQSDPERNLMNQSNSNSTFTQLENNSINSNSTDSEDDVIVDELFMEIRNLQEYIFSFFDNILSKDSLNNSTTEIQSRSRREGATNLLKGYDLRVNMPRTMESGRLFFFSGMLFRLKMLREMKSISWNFLILFYVHLELMRFGCFWIMNEIIFHLKAIKCE